MSRSNGVLGPIVEWTATGVRSFAPGQGLTSGIPSGWAAVTAALSRQNTFVRAIRIPNVSGAEADRILRLQIPQSFPVPADDLVYSYRLTNDVNEDGRLAVVAAARAGVVRNLRNHLREQGAKVTQVVPSAFGSMLLARSLGHSDAAIVESGPEGWSIDLVADGELRYSRVLPPETDPAAVEGEVRRTFDMAGLPPAPIVAAGGAVLDAAGVRTEKSTLETLAGPEGAGLKTALELPETLAARQKAAVANRARLAVLMAVAAVVVAALVLMDRFDAAANVRRRDSANQVALRKLKSSRDALQLEYARRSATNQSLVRAFEPAQSASDILAQITALAPKGIWLTGITFERGKPIMLRGIALQSNDVAAFLEALSTQNRFREVKLSYANNSVIEETKVSQFSISLHAIGNLPLVDPKSTRRTASK